MWNLNHDTQELTYRTEEGSRLAAAGGREGWLGNLGLAAAN